MLKYTQLLFALLVMNFINAQDCRVLLKELDGTYTGDCKKGKADGEGVAIGTDTYKGQFRKGLPHGSGVYTWADGRIYEGQFENGKKEGKGRLITKPDSILTGYWRKDKYAGLFERPFNKIGKSQNVSSINMNKIQEGIQNLRFYVKVNQEQVQYPNFTFVVHSGQYQNQVNSNDFVELTNVIFPIKLKAYYNQDYIEIEIFEPGLWEIKSDITFIKGLN